MELDSHLQRYAQFSVAISTVAVSLSIAHEVGYFAVIGYPLISVLSISDFLRLGLLLLPIAGGVIVVTHAVVSFLERRERVNRNIPNKKKGLYARFVMFLFTRLEVAIICISLLPLIVIICVFFFGSVVDLCIGTSLLVTMFVLYLGASRLHMKRTRTVEDLFIFSAPIAICMAFIFGMLLAANAQSQPNRILVSLREEQGYPISWGLLKATDAGVLVSHIGYRGVSFFRWEEVLSIEAVTPGCEAFRFKRPVSAFDFLRAEYGNYDPCALRPSGSSPKGK
jgi:hypothetical protein